MGLKTVLKSVNGLNYTDVIAREPKATAAIS